MAREIMTTTDVAEHFRCTARVAREHMRAIGIIDIGHGYVYLQSPSQLRWVLQ